MSKPEYSEWEIESESPDQITLRRELKSPAPKPEKRKGERRNGIEQKLQTPGGGWKMPNEEGISRVEQRKSDRRQSQPVKCCPVFEWAEPDCSCQPAPPASVKEIAERAGDECAKIIDQALHLAVTDPIDEGAISFDLTTPIAAAITEATAPLLEIIIGNDVVFQDIVAGDAAKDAEIARLTEALERFRAAYSNRGEKTSLHKWNARMKAADKIARTALKGDK